MNVSINFTFLILVCCLFVAIGTVCLDGTLPGYHLDHGFGSGANSWLIQLEVGSTICHFTSFMHIPVVMVIYWSCFAGRWVV